MTDYDLEDLEKKVRDMHNSAKAEERKFIYKVLGGIAVLGVSGFLFYNYVTKPIPIPTPIPNPVSSITITPSIEATVIPASGIIPIPEKIEVTATPTLQSSYKPTPDRYNLNFENESGWVLNQTQNKWPNFFINYSTEWSSQGTHSIKLFHQKVGDTSCNVYSHPWDRVEILQDIDFTGVKKIVYDVMPIVNANKLNINKTGFTGWEPNQSMGQGLALEIYIDDKLIKTTNEMTGQSLNESVPTGNISGIHNLRFRFRTLQESAYCMVDIGLYLDNIRLQ